MPDDVDLPEVLDLPALLAPGTGGDPAELPAYAEFETAYTEAHAALAAGEGAGEPWRRVFRQGQELLAVGKSLEVALRVTEAATHLEGFFGLHDGLKLLNGLVEAYWQGGEEGDGTSDDGAKNLLPPLDNDDPDEPFDPMARTLRLQALAVYERFGKAINAARLAASRAGGEVTLRLALAADGRLTLTGGEEAPTPDQVRSSLATAAEENPQAVAAMLKAIRESRRLAKELAASVDEKSDNRCPDLAPFDGWLRPAEDYLTPHVRSNDANAAGDDAGVAENAPEGAPAAAAPAGAAAGGGGALRTRADVEKQIDKIVEWFDRHDPSSPVRELLIYASKLINLHFFEWQQEIGEDRELMEKLRAIRYPNASE